MSDAFAPKSRGRQSRRPAEGPSDFAAGFNDFNQLALWTAAILAGMVTSMLLARTPFFRKLMDRLYPDRRPLSLQPCLPKKESLPMLTDAIVGSPRDTILAVFGPPRAAVMSGPAHLSELNFWQADTWYYALPKNGRLAMAIGFDDDMAKYVDFFSPPRAAK
jgi:hypothetical protein